MTRKIIAYLLAVASTYLSGTILISQFNIASVKELGFSISVAQHLSASGLDLIGMLGSYLPLIAVSFLIALPFTSLLLTRFIKASLLLYVLAGFVAIFAVHSIMAMVFGVTPVAATRTALGLLAQACAGGLGGYVYYVLAISKK